MQAATCSTLMARPNPVGVVGFVPTVHVMNPNPSGVHRNKRPAAMRNVNPNVHPVSGSKKPTSLN